jgi:hypothetical protein
MHPAFDPSKTNGRWLADHGPWPREVVLTEPGERLTKEPERAGIHMLEVRDEEYGDTLAVRLHGTELAMHGDYSLYAAEDGSVLVYDDRDQCLYGFEDDLPAPVGAIDVDCFRCDPALYADITEALGVDPVVDIGAAD